ncbi:MAG: type I DNA topoisomerase, partial [Ureaplasma sp.]|nr:type I DNA topoisomerase [Ureaplasma sp.]
MNLVIIEGAGKLKKITEILGKEYKVIATCGHIERLKDNEYDQTGISKNLDFNFEFIDGKSKTINEINKIANDVENIYIASDPDREGEGIAWHVYNKINKS